MTTHSAAHYLLQGLVDLGIDYVFANLGTDHAPIIEELARWEKTNRRPPEVILCPHENVAVHMAGGYALATGKGQAVLVHVDAGTANAAMALHNLARTRLPVLVMAGRAPFTIHGELTGSRDTYVHFVQDPYDMAGIVRAYVKWEYMLPSGVVINEVLRRAHTMMQSDPRGPVYLTLPREILAADIDEGKVTSFPEAKYGPVKAGGVAPEEAEAIAVELMASDNPIAATTYIGRKSEGVAVLDELARECGIRVFESFPATLNIPHDSPCFAGFNVGEGIKDADLGLLLDTDVPYIPLDHPRARTMRWIQIDVDPLKENIPVWGFATDRRYQADTAIVLRQVLEAVRHRADDHYRQKIKARIASWAPAREARAKRLAAAAAKTGSRDAMTVEYVAATLNHRLTADDIVVNEAVRNTGPTLSQMPRTKPLTYFAHSGGGLGGSGGMALGIKLARPDRRVVQVVGDGSFHFMSPDAVYAVSQQFGLPIFTVVLDNRGWQAVKASVQRVYPKGVADESGKFQARLSSGKPDERRRFDELAHAFGAHGEYVAEPAELGPAIDRCFAALKDKRSAVLTARVTSLADVPIG